METKDLEPFSSKEILGAEEIHDDWSISDFECAGYEKTVNEGDGSKVTNKRITLVSEHQNVFVQLDFEHDLLVQIRLNLPVL